MNTVLNISTGPHARDKWTTAAIMRTVCLALLPVTIVGCAVNGIYSLCMVLVSVGTAVGTEFIFDRLCHRPDTWKDFSAVVTGLLLALALPATVPLYVPFLGSLFAILVVKCCFGGLGKNFINPALAARCFLLISFSMTVTTYKVDGISSATPLAVMAAGKAVDITRMFLGTAGGVLGSSIVALVAGGMLLWALDIIQGEISFSVIGSFVLFMAVFGGQGFDPRFLLAHLCGGGVIMGAFFMATDYTTSPVSRPGQILYGCIIGVLGAMFRCFGSAADSFSYAIIIANLFTPLIDTFIVPKPFPYRKDQIALQNGEKKKTLKERIPVPVVVLAVVTLIAGLALSGVYDLTKENIEAQKLAKSAESYREVCPGAQTFEKNAAAAEAIETLNGGVYGSGFGRVRINDAVTGLDPSGNVVGYVISVTTSDGYDGDVSLSVGISPDGTVNGIAFTELNETPGMGMLCGESAFKDQFNGRNVTSFVLLKKGGSTSENEIDSVSGASTTSGAVVNAVNAALDFFRNTVKE
ncbi:MAG: RnfABCDGE type electron transport complex subunit D [Eubacteriaceae bacterium]|nr:RnfABCDGE type electron transport complex subunit D [Eubacteriaceae bacterium]